MTEEFKDSDFLKEYQAISYSKMTVRSRTKIAILLGIVYLLNMYRKPIVRRIRHVTSLLVTLSLVVACRAGGRPSDDSIFSAYRDRLTSGDSTGAEKLLSELSREDSTLDAQMANFALAWHAFERLDTQSVLLHLDNGVPIELLDHSLWLKAQLYTSRDSLRALALWESLANDTTSVYVEDALFELAENAAWRKDISTLQRITEQQRSLTSSKRTLAFDLLLAETLADAGQHPQAVDKLYGLAVEYPHTIEGRMARSLLDDYDDSYGYQPKFESDAELERELELLSAYAKHEWGLNRVEAEYASSGWQQRNDLLLFYKGRFESGLGRHKAAVQELQNHRAAYPRSNFRYRASYYLGRSAYLIDEDKVAIPSLLSVADESGDTVLVNQALEMLGILYMDRHRPQDAAVVLQRWALLSHGLPSHPDALWRLGWALWETQDYGGAQQAWTELSQMNLDSEYAPASLYWRARAAERIGDGEHSTALFHALDSLYAYSYYTIVRHAPRAADSLDAFPLLPPSLDELCVSPGLHTRKFGMLAAVRLTEPALKEWSAARREMQDSHGFTWWKAQLQYWSDNRLDAWRTIRAELGVYIRTPGFRPPDFYRIVYPLDFSAPIVKFSTERGLDPYFVFGVICQESHFEEDIVSAAGAIGLMQLMPQTATLEARKLGMEHSTARLYSADHNIHLGTVHLAELMTEFAGDTVLVLAAYNAGKNMAHEWQAEFGDRPRDEFIERIPYRETRLFVKRILEHTAAYRRLYPEALSRTQG